jgi:hypothetical protein
MPVSPSYHNYSTTSRKGCSLPRSFLTTRTPKLAGEWGVYR